jgi:hypothetical protein
MTPLLPPVGERVAVPVERGGLPAVLRLTIAGYQVSGLGTALRSAAEVQAWHDRDADADGPTAHVWAVLAAADGTRCGHWRAAGLEELVNRCADLDALERATLADLECLAVTA